MQEFPANSAKARARSEVSPPSEAPKRVERITSAEAGRRKRGVGKKFKETFITGTGKMALEFVVTDVVVPQIRDIIFESFQGGLEKWIYGDSRVRRGARPSTYSNTGHVNYQGMSSNRPPTSENRMLSRRSRTMQKYDDIVIQSRAEAQDVLDTMYEWLSRYGVITVAELYAMTGIASSHTDHQWGWTSLRGAKLARLPKEGGFVLDLPEPEALRA